MTTCGDGRWGHDRHRLLALDEAWAVLAGAVRPLGMTRVALADAAGRVLARPVVAAEDHPAFDKAMMDGFAVRGADCAAAGATLRIVGLAAAGTAPRRALSAGEAMRINTGAPLPAGADAVVRVEDTDVDDAASSVHIKTAVKVQQHVARRGGNRHAGDIVLASPARLGAAQIAAVVTAGAEAVSVYEAVGAAIVVTGDELVPLGRPLAPGQIHESNGPMLAALLGQFGAAPEAIGIVPDNEARLTEAFKKALEQPVVVAVGGMSMGTLDLVPRVLEGLGVQWAFHGVRVRPGKPVAYGRGPDGQHVFGLPGNPVSAFVCAWLFVRMVVRGSQGFAVKPPPRLRATLLRELPAKRDGRPAFVPARIWTDAVCGLIAEPCSWHGSGDPFGLAMANALLVHETPTMALGKDAVVDVIPIEVG